MRSKRLTYLIVATLCCLVAAGCSSDSSGGNGTVNDSGTGSLSLSLTDVSTDLYKAVYIKINEVQLHMGGSEDVAGNWKTVATPLEMYNLLELANGVLAQLGVSSLDTGTYQQLRLIIGTIPTNSTNILNVGHPYANYVIDLDDKTHELQIPSAISTGIKVVHAFTIISSSTTELILDFDASSSIVQAGVGNNWQLKPSIKVLETQKYATVTGIVSKSADPEASGIAGALVSLQDETTGANDPKDVVSTLTTTVSAEKDDNNNYEKGEYVLLTKPGNYRLVTFKEGYAVGCSAVNAVAGQEKVQDVELAASAMGIVEGNVSISGGGGTMYATLSFRQSLLCEGLSSNSTVEIQSVNITDGYFYQVSLPVGTYSLVVSSNNMQTVEYDGIKVTESGISYQNVLLAP